MISMKPRDLTEHKSLYEKDVAEKQKSKPNHLTTAIHTV